MVISSSMDHVHSTPGLSHDKDLLPREGPARCTSISIRAFTNLESRDYLSKHAGTDRLRMMQGVYDVKRTELIAGRDMAAWPFDCSVSKDKGREVNSQLPIFTRTKL